MRHSRARARTAPRPRPRPYRVTPAPRPLYAVLAIRTRMSFISGWSLWRL